MKPTGEQENGKDVISRKDDDNHLVNMLRAAAAFIDISIPRDISRG
jgi:hypothetical protein